MAEIRLAEITEPVLNLNYFERYLCFNNMEYSLVFRNNAGTRLGRKSAVLFFCRMSRNSGRGRKTETLSETCMYTRTFFCERDISLFTEKGKSAVEHTM
ncbi:hypothetical protein PUN28_009857 [Cardiocondyla obscurior]|uniref:Uncharacterized protein n=1 Tax=Cardiocondyla obscurior TaxID=286306 RepID=A0AAW2FMN8_9HYME